MKTSIQAALVASFVVVATSVVVVPKTLSDPMPVVRLEPIVITGHAATMPIVRLEPMVITGHAAETPELALAESSHHRLGSVY